MIQWSVFIAVLATSLTSFAKSQDLAISEAYFNGHIFEYRYVLLDISEDSRVIEKVHCYYDEGMFSKGEEAPQKYTYLKSVEVELKLLTKKQKYSKPNLKEGAMDIKSKIQECMHQENIDIQSPVKVILPTISVPSEKSVIW